MTHPEKKKKKTPHASIQTASNPVTAESDLTIQHVYMVRFCDAGLHKTIMRQLLSKISHELTSDLWHLMSFTSTFKAENKRQNINAPVSSQ